MADYSKLTKKELLYTLFARDLMLEERRKENDLQKATINTLIEDHKASQEWYKMQLAEKDKQLEKLKSENHALISDNAYQEADMFEFNSRIEQLQKKLAEKEKKYQDAIANFVNLENTRAILQLEKVKWVVEDIQYACGDDNNISRDFLIKEIDNQIKQLKEGK